MPDKRRVPTARQAPEMTEQEVPAALPAMPSVERVQQELASAKSLDDFFGKEVSRPVSTSSNGPRQNSPAHLCEPTFLYALELFCILLARFWQVVKHPRSPLLA